MTTLSELPGDASEMVGNWHSFPPPGPGFYDVRRYQGLHGLGTRFQYFANRRVYEGSGGRLLCMGRRIVRMRANEGWQFRFHQQYVDGVPINWRPMAVIYDFMPQEGQILPPNIIPQVVEKRDVSDQLPLAHSIEEARYIVRQIPERWPVFRGIHIEYTSERQQA